MSPIQFFAVNACLMFLLAFFVLLVLVVLIAAWTGVRVGFFYRRWRRSDADRKARRETRDGRPIPPRGHGICELCHGVCDDVYFLSDGRRYCDMCYDPSDSLQAAELDRAARAKDGSRVGT